jgi:DNA-directed RNA polymerase specialized sigma24 family protein
MDERDWLAERFEANRTHLRAVAYRMLASVSAADDALQESWLRLSRTDTSQVDNLRAWLTTAVARVCLDMLRSRRRREEPSAPACPRRAARTRTAAHGERLRRPATDRKQPGCFAPTRGRLIELTIEGVRRG